jgi:hypothetical protein
LGDALLVGGSEGDDLGDVEHTEQLYSAAADEGHTYSCLTLAPSFADEEDGLSHARPQSLQSYSNRYAEP